MKRIIFVSVVCLSVLPACAGGSKQQEVEPPTIELPSIPGNLTEPTERADYLITHYWENLDFTNTVKSHDKDLMEQSFVNFLSVLPYASSDEVVTQGFSILLDMAYTDPKSYRDITVLAEDYLYDPNSPMLSEDQYICFLKALLRFGHASEAQLARISDRIEMVSKNRPGTKAADFSFETREGQKSSLRESLPPEGSQLMLIFFDPDCENCDEVLGRLKADEEVSAILKKGDIRILAVYSGDNRKAWERRASDFPAEWTVGINENEIDEGELYFLPAMPTIYLLDSEGKVIQKDVRY